MMFRSAHFIDPSLRAILDSAATPDDNDLFLSNLVHTPVLAVHGLVKLYRLSSLSVNPGDIAEETTTMFQFGIPAKQLMS